MVRHASLFSQRDPCLFAHWQMGILPSILFFLAAFVCLKKQLPLPIVLVASFGVWLGAAVIHQWFLK